MKMNRIAEFQGSLMNHLNTVYRPGERDLAIELAKAIGLAVMEIRLSETHSMIAGRMNADDADILNNIVYFFEMSPAQAKLEATVRDQLDSNPELKEAVSEYYAQAARVPESTPHIGLRLKSNEQLDAIKNTLENGLSPALAGRVSVTETPPYGNVADFPDMRQVFVHTDVFTAGSGAMGQVIELQVERQRVNS
jgi:hypothetical protein